MDSFVLREGVLRLRAQQPRDSLLDDSRRQVGIDPQGSVPQASGEDDLVVRRALRRGAAGRQDGTGEGGIAQGPEPVERRLLDDALGDPAAAHGLVVSGSGW